MHWVLCEERASFSESFDDILACVKCENIMSVFRGVNIAAKCVCTTKIEWLSGGAPGSFSLSLNILNFHFLLFQFSPIFSLHENGWKSVYGNGTILCLKAVKFA